jgi:hypothetical protein
MTELSAEASAELSWLSETSRIPETELALVVADDSADCCREVLAVASDSLLLRFSPLPSGWSPMLRLSSWELKTLADCGATGFWVPLEAGRKPKASGTELCIYPVAGWYKGVCGGGVGASGVLGRARSMGGTGTGWPRGRCVSMFPVEGRAQSLGWKFTLTGDTGDCRNLGESDTGTPGKGLTFSPQS